MDDLQHQLEDVEQRARRYWFQDGLTEISCGFGLLVVGAWFFALHELQAHPAAAPAGGSSEILVNLAFPVLIFVLVWAGRRLIAFAKVRYVYPRTGYVSFRRSAGMRRFSAAIACLVGFAFTILVVRAPALVNWLPALEGLVFAVAFLFLGRKTGTLRFPVEALACAVVGLVLALQSIDENLAAALVFSGIGLVAMTGGAFALGSYLRHAPPRGRS